MESAPQSDYKCGRSLQLLQCAARHQTTMRYLSILLLAAVSARGPIHFSIHAMTIWTRESASRGRTGTRSSGWAAASTTPMASSTIRILPISNTVDRYSFKNTAFPGLSYPLNPFLSYAMSGGLGVVSPRDLDRNRKDDYVAAWTVSLQQSLPEKLVATLSYLGNKGTDVLTTTYTNLAVPPTNRCHILPSGWCPGAAMSATALSRRCSLICGAYSRTVSCFLRTTCGRIPSTTAVSAAGIRILRRTPFAAPAIKPAATSMCVSYFNVSVVYALPFGGGQFGRSWPHAVAVIGKSARSVRLKPGYRLISRWIGPMLRCRGCTP